MAKLIPDKGERQVWERDDTVIRMDISAFLAATGKNMSELADMVGLSRPTMYTRYKHPGDLSLNEMRRLYKVIGKVLALRGGAA